jgi:hypothetical protein
LALALGLAFGLGGRETASQIVRNWYNRGRQNADKIEHTANVAGERTANAAANNMGTNATTTVGSISERRSMQRRAS